jgi:iron(III) transport system permease protein
MNKKTLLRAGAGAWIWLALCAALLLPWYALPDGFDWLRDAGHMAGQADTASAWYQAARYQRAWLWAPLAALALCALALRGNNRRRQGMGLAAAATLGLLVLLAGGFLVGAGGWTLPAAVSAALPPAAGQAGFGWGALVLLVALVMLLANGVARLGYFRGDVFVACAVLFCAALLMLFIALPVLTMLAGALFGEDGALNLPMAAERIFNTRIWGLGCLGAGRACGVAWNTLFLALATAAGTTVLGALLALLTERALVRARPLAQMLATLPIVTPPFVVGLGLILLFGRAGLVNEALQQLFGIEPSRWFYSAKGVWLAQMVAFTPIAYLMMRSVVQAVAPTLEEAAQTLRAAPMKAFLSITLPLLLPGLTNAFLVGFIESMADFGNPIVVGGNFAVLSTEIFFAIVGAQLDQGKAAALALILTGFALGVFALQRRVLGKGSYTSMSGKGDNGIPPRLPAPVRRLAMGLALPWLALTIVIYLFAFAGGFIRTWGRDYSLTLQHFGTAFGLAWEHGPVLTGAAWDSLWTTLRLAGGATPLTAMVGLLIAYLIARVKFRGRDTFEFSAMLAFAIPGTVLGVAYVMRFNVPPFELTGSGLIIMLCFIFRNLPVSIRAGAAAFKQIDASLDEASSMLGASTLTSLRRVILPLLRPALVASLVYSFVRAMTTVSSVIFLVSAEHELATTFIIGRVGNGDYGVALAYCTVLTLLMLAAIGLIQLLVGERKLGRRAIAPQAARA